MGGPLYLVQGLTGEYLNNIETGWCGCPHARFRLWFTGQACKHHKFLLRVLTEPELFARYVRPVILRHG